MISDDLIYSIWKLTRPKKDEIASTYLEKLRFVLATPRRKRFLPPFAVPKKNGGTRIIVPADDELALVQRILADWIIRAFPSSRDYCYTGKGVSETVRMHLGSKCALVVDLKSAFDYVTSEKLKFAFKLYLLNSASDAQLEVICNLLTYPVHGDNETTPQGCVSTPYAYNLVLWQLDKALAAVAFYFSGLRVTRYSDNICLSSSSDIRLPELRKKVRSLIEAQGFEISWFREYTHPPFEYLGTRIYTDKLELDEEKYGEFCYLILEALVSRTPELYRKQIIGIYNWARNITGNNMPDDLFELLVRYFERVRKPPASLQSLVIAKKNLRML